MDDVEANLGQGEPFILQGPIDASRHFSGVFPRYGILSQMDLGFEHENSVDLQSGYLISGCSWYRRAILIAQ